jgi:hypothetical protein
MKWCKEVYWATMYGEWSFGFASKNKWPDKPHLKIQKINFNGESVVLHVWRFYVEVFY